MEFTIEQCRSLLHDHFGFPGFRDGQERVLSSLSQGDVLAVMPTGSGKSMCYVLPALAEGRTLVVSPLIALMQDQVDSLTAAGVPAGFINSSISRSQQNQNYLDFIAGKLKLLYVAPERFKNERFVSGLRNAGVKLLAIDEAHCISEWGHDFRPDYLTLGAVRERLGTPRTLALTATADLRVQTDIARILGFPESAVRVVTSVDRPNLSFNVVEVAGPTQARTWLLRYIKARKGSSGILYTRTRRSVEETVKALVDAGVKVAGYHAGMPDEERAGVQRSFMRDQIPVVVATNAFGLGVDKADVRFVVHMNMPGRVESYYQEAGRAGRDGDPAECTLLLNYRDEQAQQLFIDRAHPNDAMVKDIWRKMTVQDDVVTGLSDHVQEDGYASAFNALRQSGLIDEWGNLASHDPNRRIDTSSISAHKRHAEDCLLRMVEYAESGRCRRRLILTYFGEEASKDCGTCDNCRSPGSARVDPPADLIETLFDLRERLAERFGRDAAAILDSHCVRDLATHRPTDYDELVMTRGIADVKAKWFGSDILDAIRGWETAHPTAPARSARNPRPIDKSGSRFVSEEVSDGDRELYSKLAEWRLARARRDGVPAYVILSNKTLRDLALSRPLGLDALAEVWGFGQTRIQRYGAEILAVITGKF